MDALREWRIRNGPLVTVLVWGVAFGLCCLGVALSLHWSVVSALPLSGPKVGADGLWRGVFTTAAGGMLLAVVLYCQPAARTKEVGS